MCDYPNVDLVNMNAYLKYPNVDLVNMNAYIKFGEILKILNGNKILA